MRGFREPSLTRASGFQGQEVTMTLIQLLTQHAAKPQPGQPSPWAVEFRREQRVLLPVAGLPRVVRSLVTGGR